MDISLALLNAASLAFNNIDLNTYIDDCMNMLLNSGKLKAMCIIHIDTAHLIKLVCRWPSFTHAPATINNFFVRCIGALTKCTTINNFTSLCTDILTVSFFTRYRGQ